MVYLDQREQLDALVQLAKLAHLGPLDNRGLVELPGKQALQDILVKVDLPGPLEAVVQPDKLVKQDQPAQPGHQVIQDLQVFLVRVVCQV